MKTVSCIEAIKANREGKRIRIIGSDAWIVPNFFSNAVAISMKECLSEWEIEDEPLVLWVNVYPIGKEYNLTHTTHLSKDEADKFAGFDRIKCIKMVEVKE